MGRISVSLPDSLLERMQAHKNRINFSQVARAAIEKEIRNIEFREDQKNLIEIIERFRKEKEEHMDTWQKEGFEWGQDWVKKASYSEVESYIAALPRLKDLDQPWPDDEACAEYTANYQDDEDWTASAAKGFWIGFTNGAESLWNEIRKNI